MLKGERLITPSALRPEMVDKIHSSHLGMEKCLNRARDCLFWPGITKQVQDKVAKCQICNRHRNKRVKEPLMPHQLPDRPWQILAADMFVLGKDKYLVLVDYYSKYFELIRVTDSTSNTVVNVLQQHLARHGLPDIYTKTVCTSVGSTNVYCSVALPKVIRIASSTATFKKLLKTFLFLEAFN